MSYTLDPAFHDQASLVDHVSDAIISTDLESRIRSWNRAAEKIYGWTSEEVLGQNVTELLQTEFESETRDIAYAHIMEHGVWEGEVRQKHKNGHLIEIFSRVSLIQNGDEEVKGMVAVNRDISEKKEMERRFLQTARLAAMGELAGSVAHEINNPIGIMGGKARLLLMKKEQLPEKAVRDLQIIVEQCDRIAKLTKGLLGYSRASLYPKACVDLHQPLERALELVKERAHRYSCDIDFQRVDTPLLLWGNTQELEQIILNILLNAIQAMPEGGTLYVSTQCLESAKDDSAKKMVELQIADEGIGMEQDTLERIFEPFFTTKEEGTGLGLAVCHRLVHEHEVTLQVASQPGQGTQFTMSFPQFEEPAA